MCTPILGLATSFCSLQFTPNDIADELQQYSFYMHIDASLIGSKNHDCASVRNMFKSRVMNRVLLSVRSSRGDYCDANDSGVYIDTSNGRSLVTVGDFADLVAREKPDVVLSIADEVPYSCGQKRLRNAVRRSQQWFRTLRASQNLWVTGGEGCDRLLMGVVVGGRSAKGLPDGVRAQARYLLDHGADGLLLGGMGQGESFEDREQVVRAVREEVGPKITLVVQGVHSISEVTHLASLGVQVICTDCPTVLSSEGLILMSPSNQDNSETDGVPRKRARRDNKDNTNTSLVNLWDTQYAKDGSAMVPGCGCHGCR